jgi:hypothetical protein
MLRLGKRNRPPSPVSVAKGRQSGCRSFRLRSCALIIAAAASLILYGQSVSAGNAGERIPASSGVKTIVDLQPFRRTSSIRITGPGAVAGRATLTNLNPGINVWYLLELTWPGSPPESYHLENANPKDLQVTLDGGMPSGIVMERGPNKSPCDLWGTNSGNSLKAARKTGVAYAPFCKGKLYVRNPVKGHQTVIEKVTEFLRKEVPGGEEVITAVRDIFFTYLYQMKAEEKMALTQTEDLRTVPAGDAPAPALVEAREADILVKPADLGIALQHPVERGIGPGTWHAVKDNPGIYVSVMAPKWIAPEIMRSYRNVVRGLDGVESSGLVYLVAFDLERFDLKYALGTDHPGVGWSAHIPSRMRDESLAGPDGIGGSSPLARTGCVNPIDVSQTVATFTGGFKRYHGAFKYGPLSLRNHGSHYGFVEDGVLFSTLQPDLSTIYVLKNGRTEMKTWNRADGSLLADIRYARQNGVPLIAGWDPAGRISVPGALVGQWGPGNWSGSAKGDLRTMRSGVGLQEIRGKRFLLYAFFWSATPSAMTRVFQAYQVRHAMLLDMNALVHTYLALYKTRGSDVYVQHLIRGMEEADMSVKGRRLPRFLAYADDRDFFYLTRKEAR